MQAALGQGLTALESVVREDQCSKPSADRGKRTYNYSHNDIRRKVENNTFLVFLGNMKLIGKPESDWQVAESLYPSTDLTLSQ